MKECQSKKKKKNIIRNKNSFNKMNYICVHICVTNSDQRKETKKGPQPKIKPKKKK